MKRLIMMLLLVALAISATAFAGVGAAAAEVNAVTPSTNDINTTNGWANVQQLSKGLGTTDVKFSSTRGFASCFEYRTDGKMSQSTGDNYNPAVTDGLYPFKCVNNSTVTITVSADEYVEVRMVFGAEGDERFDWTRFNVEPKCEATGFRNLTAKQIGGNVTGSLDATGCDIGVYYAPGTTGSVTTADISGALYYGVVANAAVVNVTNSTIHHIGDTPLNGVQRGVGVYYTTLNPDLTPTAPAAAATGTVSGNIVTKYQKGGIVVNGPGAAVTISGNTVTGEGRVAYIAQNGIQVGRGATGTITGNTVTGNAYTGAAGASSAGILVFGGGSYGPITTGVSVTTNTLINNDMGVYVYNTDASGSKPPATKTKNSVVNNTISNDGATNLSGNGAGGYQAGIVDYGNKDNIVNNKVSGVGYNTNRNGSVFTQFDLAGSTKAHFNNNG